jgi:carbonic anhydrase
MAVRDEVLEANRSYAQSFDKGDLPTPPGRRFAVVTCMDARLDPAKFLGLDEGDAHVIRNAGASSPTTRFARSSSRTGCSGLRRRS